MVQVCRLWCAGDFDVNVPHNGGKRGCNRVPCCLAKAAQQIDSYYMPADMEREAKDEEVLGWHVPDAELEYEGADGMGEGEGP